MYTIQLKEVEFFGYHGVFAEEQIVGTTFVVNVEVQIAADNISSLEQSVNYGLIFEKLQQIFAEKEALLEVLCTKCIAAIETLGNHFKKITVSIQKKQPPIMGGFIGNVIVKKEKLL
jgi:7,8-dihydroneopterin aldolase/epimerase/oxygenase